MDLPDANPDRVRQQLSDLGLIPEEWGGANLFTEISALRGEGIDKLLENILLQAELLDLKATTRPARWAAWWSPPWISAAASWPR